MTSIPILDLPADRIPDVVDSDVSLLAMTRKLASLEGPIGIDTERAQSFRYTGRAYLIQLKREDQIFLLDPTAFTVERLAELADILGQAEWILHAATQDLPCLVELGFVPKKLFDTELAAKLLGYERVGLASLVEKFFGVQLLKKYSAVDWSTRPLPNEWLEYAGLDVELLIELRTELLAQLQDSSRQDWANQEFDFLVAHCQEHHSKPDPWRRTSGIHQIRSKRGLELVRQLWLERDKIAAKTDTAPSRILPDKAITALASRISPENPVVPKVSEMFSISSFRHRNAIKYRKSWIQAVEKTRALPKIKLPKLVVVPPGTLPSPKSWTTKNPQAAARWNASRPLIVQLSEELNIGTEYLINPAAMRQFCWEPLKDQTNISLIEARLAELNVRAWQRELVSPIFAQAFGDLS